MKQNVMTMNERSILHTVQQWRRTKYSARPFALTILAITLITLLAWAKERRGETLTGDVLHRRDITILDQEVGHHTQLQSNR